MKEEGTKEEAERQPCRGFEKKVGVAKQVQQDGKDAD